MAESRPWSLLYLIPILCQVLADDPKGLMVASFPTWFDSAHLELYHGDPSNYKTGDTPGLYKQYIGDYAQVTSIVSNTKESTFYFLDASSNTIYNYNNFTFYMNHTQQSFSKIHSGVSATTSQIAYDWLANNIYWTDGFYKWICTHPAKPGEDLSLYKVLVKDHLMKPEGITVDPYKRYLFWSDVDQVRGKSKIERTNLAGENRKVIIQMDSPIWISSLAVDTDTQTLYWVDMGRQTLEMSDYEGTLSTRKVLTRQLGTTFLSMAIGKDVICATEFNYYYVMCFDKATGNNTWFTSYIDQEVWGISIYDSSLQKAATHPCQTMNCEHMCFNMDETTARCECKEGYKLQTNGSCLSEDSLLFGKGFIITNSTDACLYDAHITNNGDQTPHCFLTNLTGVSFFVVDSHERQFYYVDSTKSKVKVVDMVTKREKEVFSDTTGQVEISGLALDWTTKSLFWTDAFSGKIVVHSLITNTRNDNFITSLDNPSFISVDPHRRKIYWLTGKSVNTVDAANLDGSNVHSVVSKGKLNGANALFYDILSQRLFYVNGDGEMESVLTDGTSLDYHVYSGRVSHILAYKEFVLWTSGDKYLEMAHKTSYFADVYMDVGYMGTPTAIGIYDRDMQPSEVNNCTNNNGGCQHICQPTATSMICICNFGYRLNGDGKTCFNEPFYDEFAIISDVSHDRLYQIGLSNAELRAIDIPDVSVPVSVIYDKHTERLYWSNAIMAEIRSATLKATQSEVMYDTWTTLPVGLAFDYSSGLLYFTTEAWYDPSYIACIHPTVRKKKTLVKNLDLPKNIALYPSKGLMFWTDISTTDNRNSYIGKAYMDGTNVTKIVTTDVNAPNGIVIDFSTNTLFWADAGLSKIFSVDLNGNGRKTIVEEPNAGIVGLDISPPYLFYVGRNKQHVSKIEISTNNKLPFMNDVHALGRIESIRVYPEQNQPLNDACKVNNGGCALFCLPTPHGRMCACEDGDQLKEDGKSCSNHISCPTNIPNALLADRCIGHATGTCNFTCASGYEKTVDVLKCDDTGNWNQPVHTVCQSINGVCDAFIPNGHVSTACDKRINSVCSYVCNAGYVPKDNSTTITCTNSGAWSKPVQDLCIMSTKYCPEVLHDANLSPDCTRAPGSQCDYTCKSGFRKNVAITALVCLASGQWNFNGLLCEPETSVRCPTAVPNGAFGNQCSFLPGKICSYSCNAGFMLNPSITYVYCKNDGNWDFSVDSLCVAAKASCNKVFPHGNFIEPCSAAHGETCNYQCDKGYIQQPIVQHVTCKDGKWAVDRTQLCIVVEDNPTVSQAQVQEGTSAGAVAGVVISVVVITLLIVLVVIYFVWWKRRPRDQLMANTNLKFKKFDDTHVNIDSGVGGFSNPIAQQPDYGNFGNCREEGYVTADINPRYQNVEPSDVNVTVNGVPSAAKNGDLQSTA